MVHKPFKRTLIKILNIFRIGCSTITFFKQNARYFALVGGFITLITLLTPTSFSTDTIATYYVWMFQIFLHVDPPPINVGLLRTDPTLLTISIILTVIIFLNAIITILGSSLYRKRLDSDQKRKRFLLIPAILIIVSTLVWIIMMEGYYMYYGSNHWVGLGEGHYIPYLGIIGPFIGSVLIVIGVLSERNIK